MILTHLTKYRDFGLLFLRIGLGLMFAFIHGWPKLIGGPDLWKRLGSAMQHIGISFAPEFWGLMAALAEFGGGLLLVVGFLFRPAAIGLAVTMIIASLMKFNTEGTLFGAAHPIEMAIIFVALIFIGPGRFSIDRS